jgi:hypothetical protein
MHQWRGFAPFGTSALTLAMLSGVTLGVKSSETGWVQLGVKGLNCYRDSYRRMAPRQPETPKRALNLLRLALYSNN